MKHRRIMWYVIGAVIIIIVPIYGFTVLRNAFVPYKTFTEARSMEHTVQVSGRIVPGTRRYNRKLHCWEFVLEDTAGVRARVRYRGTPPAGFENTPMAVVVGKFQNDIFEAERLLLKCPSKYESAMRERIHQQR